MSVQRCFLFDIDGTLVNLRSIWEEMYMSLYKDVAGFVLSDAELLSKFGPPEYEGHKTLLEGRRLYSPKLVEDLVVETEKRMVQRLGEPDIPRYVIPHVRECLDRLRGEGENSIGIVTGNMQTIAEAILQGVGLREYFSVVGCSDELTTRRAEIVQKAMSAFNVLGNRFDSQNVYVIGDTPKDIEGARDCGYVSVAVATGHYSFEELARDIPDYVLPDLREFSRILR